MNAITCPYAVIFMRISINFPIHAKEGVKNYFKGGKSRKGKKHTKMGKISSWGLSLRYQT